jgi:hypothetical protein
VTALWSPLCPVSGCGHLPPTASQLCCRLYLLQFTGGSHHIHLLCRFCLFRVLPGTCPSPFLQCRVLQACYSCSPCYLEFMWVTALPPLSSGVCHTSTTVASLVHSEFAGESRQTHLLWQGCLFKVHTGACPSPFLWSSRHPTVFATCPFQFLVFFFRFFFSPGCGSDCPGFYAGLSQGWLWGYHMPLICSPVGLHLPSRLGAGVWQFGSPPDFSV